MKRTAKAFAPLLLLSAISIEGCKTDVAEAANPPLVQVPGNSSSSATAKPTPSPTPTPTTAPLPSPTLAGAAAIASNFDINRELTTAPVPGSSSPDPTGAFRFICNAAQLLYDDPIVYPGQPGKSHLHQFYGNTGANAQSTYDSLRKTGQSTCMSPLNRSAYWMPAMLDGRGHVVRPDFVAVYYKRRPSSDPKCQQLGGTVKGEGICVDLPNGLKFIFGYDMITGKAPTGELWYNCKGSGAIPGHYANIQTAARYCPAGSQIGAIIHAPGCWDGKNLDSPNHRDHVAYTTAGTWGYRRCPSSHPYRIPAFQLQAYYSVEAGDDLSRWTLSSDAMRPGLPHGSTFHADFFMAWDPLVKNMWHDNCFNKRLSCSAGNLGNGRNLKQFEGFSFAASPRLVSVP